MFDPYRKWLGIPKWEQPPNHYRLLGINLFENDPDVIETAADRQMGHVRNYQAGKHSEWSQRLLNELSAARICLLNAEKKKAYDEKLRADLAVRSGDVVIAGPPFGFFVRGAAQYFGVVARQFWISRFVLPRVYAALGRDIVCQGRYRDRMPELYARLEEMTRRLAELQAATTPAAAETPKTSEMPETPETPDEAPDQPPAAASEPVERVSMVKRATRRLAIRIKSAYLSFREAAILQDIARTAWRIDYERTGPGDLTAPVREALTGIEEYRAEVRTLSEVPPDQWLSPKRLAWIVLAVLGLIAALYLLIRWIL